MEKIGRWCFSESGLTEISIPSSVISIEDYAFWCCEKLKRVTFAEDNKLERIGNRCFYDSGIKEMTLPSTLKEVGDCTFDECTNLENIYVEEGCEASLADTGVHYGTRVILLSTALVGGVSI